MTGNDVALGAAEATGAASTGTTASSSYVGFAVRFARGPRRGARSLATPWSGSSRRSVGAMFEWRDPLPGVLFGLAHLRHPRALIRPFLVDIELGRATPSRGRPS